MDLSSDGVDDSPLGVVSTTGFTVDFSSDGVDDSPLGVVSTTGLTVDFF